MAAKVPRSTGQFKSKTPSPAGIAQLGSPLHDAARATILAAVRAALASAGLTLADVGSDTSVTQLLLGSLPRTVASVLAGGDGLALRDTLRASAVFIQSVYHSRWAYGHKFGQSD